LYLSVGQDTLYLREFFVSRRCANLKRKLLAASILVLVSVALVAVAPVRAQPQGRAVILSSLDALAPMGYYAAALQYDLIHAGYQVSFLSNSAVTLDFIATQLNNYDVVIWRTNTYSFAHITYWYVGQTVNAVSERKYADDFEQGRLNGNAGILGVSPQFLSEHLGKNSLTNVKLVVLVSSNSVLMASSFISAGAKAVISCNGAITLSFGQIDDLTTGLFYYLASGNTVYASVYNTVAPFSKSVPEDPLDSFYSPPFWFTGNGELTIT
jgi:hypothetical protein